VICFHGVAFNFKEAEGEGEGTSFATFVIRFKVRAIQSLQGIG
jgi:hypothetical protein